MSAIQNNQTPWTSLSAQQLDSKYEKCRNITEEIYKRINITFQIKKLETGDQSDVSVNSDQIDSNELSNETDLFACDKSDITSSTEAERAPVSLTINNNLEEKLKPVHKKPRKRFRKRVKKRTPVRKQSDSEGSSDEAPLSRSALILATDIKSKPQIIEKKPKKKDVTPKQKEEPPKSEVRLPTVLIEKIDVIDKSPVKSAIEKTVSLSMVKKVDERSGTDWKSCNLCSLSFRGERGLRRHMSMSHIVGAGDK